MPARPTSTTHPFARPLTEWRASGPMPSGRRVLLGLLAGLGASAFLAALGFLLAWNWANLGRAGQFAIASIPLLVAAAVLWRKGVDGPFGAGALVVAALGTGLLLATVDRIFHAGADDWTLHASWALLILPFVAVGRLSELWLLAVALLHLAVHARFAGSLSWLQVGPSEWLALAALEAGALLAWEASVQRGWIPIRARRLPRLLALALFATSTTPALQWIVRQDMDHVLGLPLWAGACALALVLRRRFARDPFPTALAAFSAVLVTGVALGRWVFRIRGLRGPVMLLILGLAFFALVWIAVVWLRRLSRSAKPAADSQPENEDADRWPRHLAVLQGLGVWASTLLLGGAVAWSTKMDRPLGVGAVALLVGLASLRSRSNSVFLLQLGLAASFIGQAFLGAGLAGLEVFRLLATHGLSQRTVETVFVPLAFAGLEAVLFVVVRQRVHRFVVALAGFAALAFMLANLRLAPALTGAAALGCAAIWLAEARRPGRWPALRLAGWALVVLLLVFAPWQSWSARLLGLATGHPWGGAHAGTVGALASLAALAWAFLAAFPAGLRGLTAQRRAGLLVALAAVAAAGWALPGLWLAVLLLLLGHAAGSRSLAGLGLGALVWATVHHYYSLDATLLAKSGWLALTGLALLLAAGFVARLWPRDEEGSHA